MAWIADERLVDGVALNPKDRAIFAVFEGDAVLSCWGIATVWTKSIISANGASIDFVSLLFKEPKIKWNVREGSFLLQVWIVSEITRLAS